MRSSRIRLESEGDPTPTGRGRRNGDGVSAPTGTIRGVGGGVGLLLLERSASPPRTTAGVAAYEKPAMAGSMTSRDDADDDECAHLRALGPLGAGVGDDIETSSPPLPLPPRRAPTCDTMGWWR